MRLKVYLLLYESLQEVRLPIPYIKLTVPKEKALKGAAWILLTKAERDALNLTREDSELLWNTSKPHRAEGHKENPWTYQSTIQKYFGSPSLVGRLNHFRIKGMVQVKFSETNGKTLWRLTDYGDKVLEATTYIRRNCPELLEANEPPPV